MKRFVFAIMAALLFHGMANAQGASFTWEERDGAAYKMWTLKMGTANSATAFVAAASVSDLLQIPFDAEFAAFSIRKGTDEYVSSNYKTYGETASDAAIHLGLFNYREEAVTYRDNFASYDNGGKPPEFRTPIALDTGVTYLPYNDSNYLFKWYSNYMVPVKFVDYMIIYIDPEDTTGYSNLNTAGLTITVRFWKFERW